MKQKEVVVAVEVLLVAELRREVDVGGDEYDVGDLLPVEMREQVEQLPFEAGAG